MAKTLNRDTKSVNNDGDVKKRKKQAKAEAKLMLQIEQAKKDVEKSHQKIAKAERVLQERTTRLNELENQLTQLQTNGKVSPRSVAEFATADTSQTATAEPAKTPITIGSDIHIEPDSGESYEDNEDIITQHREEQEPAEGRSDITEIEQQPTSTADTNSTTPEASPIANLPKDEQVVSSGEGSIPIVTSDEHAWPPPNIREELAEGIVEQAKEKKEREQEEEKISSDVKASETAEGSTETERDNNNDKQTTSHRRSTTRRRRSNTTNNDSNNH